MVTMNRLEIFRKLSELESRKETLQGLASDLSDGYCNGVIISAILDTNMFSDRRKYTDDTSINVDKIRFLGFLEQEIESVDSKISELLGGLK